MSPIAALLAKLTGFNRSLLDPHQSHLSSSRRVPRCRLVSERVRARITVDELLGIWMDLDGLWITAYNVATGYSGGLRHEDAHILLAAFFSSPLARASPSTLLPISAGGNVRNVFVVHTQLTGQNQLVDSPFPTMASVTARLVSARGQQGLSMASPAAKSHRTPAACKLGSSLMAPRLRGAKSTSSSSFSSASTQFQRGKNLTTRATGAVQNQNQHHACSLAQLSAVSVGGHAVKTHAFLAFRLHFRRGGEDAGAGFPVP